MQLKAEVFDNQKGWKMMHLQNFSSHTSVQEL